MQFYIHGYKSNWCLFKTSLHAIQLLDDTCSGIVNVLRYNCHLTLPYINKQIIHFNYTSQIEISVYLKHPYAQSNHSNDKCMIRMHSIYTSNPIIVMEHVSQACDIINVVITKRIRESFQCCKALSLNLS